VAIPEGTVEYRDKSAQAPPLTMALLERGQERFRIYCTPCHSELGDGHGMIVQRGFPAPPSYHIDRLRAAPIQHFFEVMTQGYGAMYPFADRVSPQDRWAIAAYIRALQKSQAVSVTDITRAERGALQ
jgi:mono/diheme cytochrome c family protein